VYTGTLCLSSNDLLAPQLTIPLTLSVSPTVGETAGVAIAQSDGSTAVAEGGAADSYSIVLDSRPTAAVTISFDTGSQLQPIAAMTFTPSDWNVPQVATVRAADDLVAEGTRATTITHSAHSADPRYDGAALPIASVSVTITDNDIVRSSTYIPFINRTYAVAGERAQNG
jgi:hypothetical protein